MVTTHSSDTQTQTSSRSLTGHCYDARMPRATMHACRDSSAILRPARADLQITLHSVYPSSGLPIAETKRSIFACLVAFAGVAAAISSTARLRVMSRPCNGDAKRRRANDLLCHAKASQPRTSRTARSRPLPDEDRQEVVAFIAEATPLPPRLTTAPRIRPLQRHTPPLPAPAPPPPEPRRPAQIPVPCRPVSHSSCSPVPPPPPSRSLTGCALSSSTPTSSGDSAPQPSPLPASSSPPSFWRQRAHSHRCSHKTAT